MMECWGKHRLSFNNFSFFLIYINDHFCKYQNKLLKKPIYEVLHSAQFGTSSMKYHFLLNVKTCQSIWKQHCISAIKVWYLYQRGITLKH